MNAFQRFQSKMQQVASDAKATADQSEQRLIDKKLKCPTCGTKRFTTNAPHCKHCGASYDPKMPDLKDMVRVYAYGGTRLPEQQFQRDATELATYGWRVQAQSAQTILTPRITVSYHRD